MSTKDISIWVRRAMCWCRISEAIWSIPISAGRAAIWRRYVDLQAASLMEAAAILREDQPDAGFPRRVLQRRDADDQKTTAWNAQEIQRTGQPLWLSRHAG